MNVILPEKPKILNRRNVTYMTILIVCAVAVAIAMYQFFSEEKLGVIIGITKDENEEINQLRTEFNSLFTNELKIEKIELDQTIKKDEQEKDIVYTGYQKEEKSVNNYSLDVKLPYININSDVTKKFNEKIQKIFENPAEDILQTENRNIIYTVNYAAFIENDILSIAIISTFKEDNNVQRTIFKVYNYNIKNNEEATLDDFTTIKNIDKQDLEDTIKFEIKNSQAQTEQLKELGYDIFSRDINDEMYKVENATDYFIYDGYLYIIYAYGNTNNTSEMDIVII